MQKKIKTNNEEEKRQLEQTKEPPQIILQGTPPVPLANRLLISVPNVFEFQMDSNQHTMAELFGWAEYIKQNFLPKNNKKEMKGVGG